MQRILNSYNTLKNWQQWLIDLAFIFLIIFAIQKYQLRDTASGPTPSFTAQKINGETFSSEELKGQPTVLYFWATWCAICKAELPVIKQFAQTHRIISIAMISGDNSKLSAYAKENSIKFPIITNDSICTAEIINITLILEAK